MVSLSHPRGLIRRGGLIIGLAGSSVGSTSLEFRLPVVPSSSEGVSSSPPSSPAASLPGSSWEEVRLLALQRCAQGQHLPRGGCRCRSGCPCRCSAGPRRGEALPSPHRLEPCRQGRRRGWGPAETALASQSTLVLLLCEPRGKTQLALGLEFKLRLSLSRGSHCKAEQDRKEERQAEIESAWCCPSCRQQAVCGDLAAGSCRGGAVPGLP